MKNFMLAWIVALLMILALGGPHPSRAQQASGLELACGAPRVALGDTNDTNPVVNVAIKYVRADHSWRVFHHLRNGLVVSRSEQYAMQDASNDRKLQWQSSLNRNRSLVMIGEVRRVENGVVYMEWLYDRNRDNALVMQATAQCAMTGPLPRPTAEAPTAPKAAEPPVPLEEGTHLATAPTPSQPLVAAPTVPSVLVPPKSVQTQRIGPLEEPMATGLLPASRTACPIYSDRGGRSVAVDVIIGGQPLRMMIDTGASA